jgi:hypothetical protein
MNKQLRPKLFLLASLAAAATAVVWSVPASSDTVFSNLGPDNTYRPGPFGFPVYSFPPNFSEIAAAFTPKGDFTLTQVDVGIVHDIVGTNSVMLSLEGANAKGLPDGIPLLKPLTFTDLPLLSECETPFETVCVIQPTQMKPTSPVELFKGTEYWLVASSPSGSFNSWNVNITGAAGLAGNNNFTHGWVHDNISLSPAFAVLGTPVSAPEPATLGLMVLGLLGAGFAGRKRRS